MQHCRGIKEEQRKKGGPGRSRISTMRVSARLAKVKERNATPIRQQVLLLISFSCGAFALGQSFVCLAVQPKASWLGGRAIRCHSEQEEKSPALLPAACACFLCDLCLPLDCFFRC